MNFKDIKKFTSRGHYQIDIELQHLKEDVERYQKNYGLEINPDFQRGNVWVEQQQIDFVEYLLKGGSAQTTLFFNHPGWMNSFEGDFVLVDGLQRLTACLKFVNNEIKAFGFFFNEFEGRISTNTGFIFNINDLKTRKEVLTWYIEMNTGGTVHSDSDINRVKDLLEKEI